VAEGTSRDGEGAAAAAEGAGEASGVQAALRALALLEAVVRRERARLTELAGGVGLSKSTAHRFLATLQSAGYVEQDADTGQYRAGLRLMELAGRVLARTELQSAAIEEMQALQRRTAESVNLVLLREGQAVYVAQVSSRATLRHDLEVGRRAPAHCTAAGKVLLAHNPDAVDAVVRTRGLPALTERSIVSPDELQRHLRQVAAQGYALDEEEHEPGACCVAAPVRDSAGRVVAALSVSGPALRLTPERLRATAPAVVEAAWRISRRLGCPEPERSPCTAEGEGMG
jgi:IclR family KDG regulon transcriptional repressor